jgi:hypothetical protein
LIASDKKTSECLESGCISVSDEKFACLHFFVEEAVYSRYEIKKRWEEWKDVVGVARGFGCECAPCGIHRKDFRV